MLKINEIKEKAWEMVNCTNYLTEEQFYSFANSFKISKDYNLAIWCNRNYREDNKKYLVISINYNPRDKWFGDEISGLEYTTNGASKEELEQVIDTLIYNL